jgi:formiminotetrahydrofolate cyclodeaminase
LAYGALMKAYKIPKAHPDRPGTVSDALLKATEVPLEIAERACEVTRVLHGLRQVVKPTVYSDLTVGMILAIATAEAGIFTVLTNVKHSTNQLVMESVQAKIIKTRESLEELRRLC